MYKRVESRKRGRFKLRRLCKSFLTRFWGRDKQQTSYTDMADMKGLSLSPLFHLRSGVLNTSVAIRFAIQEVGGRQIREIDLLSAVSPESGPTVDTRPANFRFATQ